MATGYPDWTMQTIAISNNLKVAIIVSDSVEHFNGSIGTTATTITPAGNPVSFLINNTHASQNILVSFDAGTTFFTIKAGFSLSVDTSASSFQIKGSAATTTYEILVGIAA